jgi:adenine-specific DNA glycosylase
MELIQSKYRNEPWKVLATCILLNRVQGSTAEPIIHKFFKKIKSSTHMFFAKDADILHLIYPLGLARHRLKNLRRMTKDYVAGKPFDQIRGIGRYGQDAWKIFVEGNISIEPNDTKLKAYVSYMRGDDHDAN